MYLQQQNAQQATMSTNTQPTYSQSGSQLTVSCTNQFISCQVSPQTVTTLQAPISVSSVKQQIAPQEQSNVQDTVQSQLFLPQQHYIWQGILEWTEKVKNFTEMQKQTRHVQCQISVNLEDKDPELKVDTWPSKLIMQLMPEQLIGSTSSSYLKNSKIVNFHLTNCDALESLTKMMSAGFAGCVSFSSVPLSPPCEIKILLLLYSTEKKSYFGVIPYSQIAFIDSLRNAIKQEKIFFASMRQNQDSSGLENTTPAPMRTTDTQGIFMSRTNIRTKSGRQITRNVIPSNVSPLTLSTTVPQINEYADIEPKSKENFDEAECMEIDEKPELSVDAEYMIDLVERFKHMK